MISFHGHRCFSASQEVAVAIADSLLGWENRTFDLWITNERDNGEIFIKGIINRLVALS